MSTDSDGLKCWKELVGRLPSATPNPRGFSTRGRRSRELRILASGLDGSMPLTVSWPPSRNHPLFLCLRLTLSLSSLFYHEPLREAFHTRLYRILRIKCRNSLSALCCLSRSRPCLNVRRNDFLGRKGIEQSIIFIQTGQRETNFYFKQNRDFES